VIIREWPLPAARLGFMSAAGGITDWERAAVIQGLDNFGADP